MRRMKVIILILFLLVSILVPSVFSNPVKKKYTENDDINSCGRPDLIGSLKIVEFNNSHYFQCNITNIGDAPASFFKVNITAYPFGTYLFRDKFYQLLRDLLTPQALLIITIPLIILKISPSFLLRLESSANFSLEPNESYILDSMIPFDSSIEDYINSRTCVIIEVIVDEYNEIIESNELNNRDVIKWWFPLKTDYPMD